MKLKKEIEVCIKKASKNTAKEVVEELRKQIGGDNYDKSKMHIL